jgi:hypothetical protein
VIPSDIRDDGLEIAVHLVEVVPVLDDRPQCVGVGFPAIRSRVWC